MKNSHLYECTVMHHRLEPRDNKFAYKIFMFCLDLDEIEDVVTQNYFISRNRFNLFNFRDRDHLQLPASKPDTTKDIKQHIVDYAVINGIEHGRIHKIKLITNLCTLGYQFNPVSYYFCYDHTNEPVCAIVEVCNTFHEMKTYFLGKESFKENRFNTVTTKHFYVSPFIDMDVDFHFNLHLPGEKLNISINDFKKGKRFFLSTLIGERKALTNLNVLAYALRFPFITLQIIGLIHWQALRLWMKKLNFHRKASGIELQQHVLRPHKSIVQ